jgi:hypothetical protein
MEQALKETAFHYWLLSLKEIPFYCQSAAAYKLSFLSTPGLPDFSCSKHTKLGKYTKIPQTISNG